MSTIPVASSTSSILVLACENLVLGDRQELEISSSNVAGSAFENNLTYIRAIMRGDVFLMRAAALEIITGVAH
jgi:HK97 family phage major capsid protein